MKSDRLVALALFAVTIVLTVDIVVRIKRPSPVLTKYLKRSNRDLGIFDRLLSDDKDTLSVVKSEPLPAKPAKGHPEYPTRPDAFDTFVAEKEAKEAGNRDPEQYRWMDCTGSSSYGVIKVACTEHPDLGIFDCLDKDLSTLHGSLLDECADPEMRKRTGK